MPMSRKLILARSKTGSRLSLWWTDTGIAHSAERSFRSGIHQSSRTMSSTTRRLSNFSDPASQIAGISSGRYLALLLGIHIIQRGYRRLDGLVPLIPELVIDQIVVLEIRLLDIHLPLLILCFEDRIDVQQLVVEQHLAGIIIEHVPQLSGDLDQVVIAGVVFHLPGRFHTLGSTLF